MTSENMTMRNTNGVVRCPKCKERMIHLNYGHRRYGWYCLHCGTEIEVDTVGKAKERRTS